MKTDYIINKTILNKLQKVAYIILLLLVGSYSYAHELFISSLNSSIDKCYPKILNAVLQKELAQGNAKKNKSPFDTRITGASTQRGGSQYGTNYERVALEKRFYDSPIAAYSGFDISTGYVPQYDSAQVTSTKGREFVGLKLNLLRGFAIDKERLALYNSILDTDKAKYEINLSKLIVKTEAIKAYINWLIAGSELRAYQRLLHLAETRQKQLKKRYQKGDLAKIAITENYNYILRRRRKVMAAKNYFNQAALALSMYYRNGYCKISKPNENLLPDELPSANILQSSNDTQEINAAIRNRPEFKVIETQLEQVRRSQDYADTELFPKLAINAQFNNNNSTDSTTSYFVINQQEVVGKLTFSMPLERSRGKGLTTAASRKMKKLLNEKQFLVDQISTQVRALHYSVNNTKKQVELAKGEYNVAKKLVTAEKKRISNGSSNFFVLNAREENMTKAYLSYLTSLKQNYNASIQYNFLNGKNVNLNSVYSAVFMQ